VSTKPWWLRSTGVAFKGINHVAFAVKDAKATLEAYQKYFDLREVKYREPAGIFTEGAASFYIGDIPLRISVNQSARGRYHNHIAKCGESLQHICFEVDDIKALVDVLVSRGARLAECELCKVTGPHPHPDGWVAFLDPGTVPGLQFELMQVYTKEQKREWEASEAKRKYVARQKGELK